MFVIGYLSFINWSKVTTHAIFPELILKRDVKVRTMAISMV